MEELHADREVVLAAVAQNGRALEYASQELSGFRQSRGHDKPHGLFNFFFWDWILLFEFRGAFCSKCCRSVLCPDVMTFLSMVARTWTSQASPNASSLASLSGL